MSYHARIRARRAATAARQRRPMSGISTRMTLGSLGDDSPASPIADPAFQWQADVLSQLRAGVATLQKAELQKWLQIAATLSIPLAAAAWRAIFRRGAKDPTV